MVLGARTCRRLGVGVGDTVRVEIGKTEHDFRVVGQGVFPEFGDAGQLGTGAYMTFDGVHRLLPTALRNTYLVRYADRSAVDRERQLVASAVVPYPTRQDARPQDLVDLARGDGLLGFLSVALALLALAVLVHALVTTTRDARRDFAVLRALGLLRPQVWWTVGWQVASIMGGALLVGIPLGLAVGQLAWERFATSLGIASDAVVPAGSLALAVSGAVVIVGVGCARTRVACGAFAAGSRPAQCLNTRDERFPHHLRSWRSRCCSSIISGRTNPMYALVSV